MIIELLLFLIAFLGLILASIFDLKTTEVPDFLSYSLITAGLSLRLMHSVIYNDWKFSTSSLLILLLFFILGSLLYYSKQWGGADAKLLMALAVLIPSYPSFLLRFISPNLELLPFPLILVTNILIVGSIYGLLWAIVLAIKHREKFLPHFKTLFNLTKRLRLLTYFLVILLILLSFLAYNSAIKTILLSLSFILFLLLYLWIFIKAVEDTSMYKFLHPSELREGDQLAKTLLYKGKKITSSPYGLTKDQIALIKNLNLRSILIKEGIPFIPSFLIGFILSILLGSPLSLLFMVS
jgi:prepilin signal peptidase PulO-like enzyme (type II secretory pathway)